MSKWRIVERTAQEGSTIVPHTIFHGHEEMGRDKSYSEAVKLVAGACLNNDRIIEEDAAGRTVERTGKQLRESLAKDKAFDQGR